MTRGDLVRRSLRHYWRVHLAVALGVGIAVSALGGAFVVGESVRASLRELALARLGRAHHVVTAANLFTAQLAERLSSAPAFGAGREGIVPVLALEGVVTHERSGSRAGAVQVYGVDDRFWTFNAIDGVTGPAGRDAFLSPALAAELGASAGDALLLRVQKPSAVPAGLIQGRRNEPGRAIRLSTAQVLDRSRLGDFSPRPQQGATRTIFVPLDRLQRDLESPHRVNMLLAAQRGDTAVGSLESLVEQSADLADLGVRTRPLEDQALALESDAGLLTDAIARAGTDASRAIGVEPVPVLTYLATAIRANDREIPYSLVTALPEHVINAQLPTPKLQTSTPNSQTPTLQPVWLTRWAANDLAAKVGDAVTIEYYLWSDDAGLTTGGWEFTLAGVLPMERLAVDADLTPEYPGMSTSPDISDWDPPFPVDLKRIRPKDEEYWDRYHTAPKAFVRLEDGQTLWRSRYGSVSSLRIPARGRSMADLHAAYRKALAKHLSTRSAGFRAIPVRDNALAAAAGTTDFGEYFTYFSFFLVASSLLLTLLFFRLGVESRAREVGLLAAMGYTPNAIRSGLLAEGAVVAIVGAAIGIAGALAYSWLVMYALRTWWVDAVGTTDLALHVSPAPLATGAVIGVVAGLLFIAWSLRVLRRASARGLMSGAWVDADAIEMPATGTTRATAPGLRVFRDARALAASGAALALALVVAGFMGWLPQAGAFFGSGTLLLAAGLGGLAAWLRGTSRRTFTESAWPIARLGLRNARYRPSRSVLSAALIASATFLIVSVGAFRRGAEDLHDPTSASGGYALIGETIAPLMHDPSTPGGREALALGPELDGIEVARFRLRPGDDASCLNLYRPQSPRLLGATRAFVRANRFSFAHSMADTPEEAANPWLLLNRRFEDGAVPVVGDATSLAYVFHLAVGDDYVMQGPDGGPLTLRIVGALRDSVLQSELVMGDAHFTRLFPRNEGFRVFLVGGEAARVPAVAAALEEQLQDFGMDVQSTAERLASYHRVENTFLTTFQALGALGLVLGTLGLGTVLLRNVLERRRELAVLRATGYRRAHLVQMVMAESVFLLACGLVLGVLCAAVAIGPAYAQRAQPFPVLPTLALLVAVFAAGMLSTVMAARAVATMPLLEGLKNE
ncbi:MAG: FtsX-like permease family protein [Vicinamibacterales bacterium]